MSTASQQTPPTGHSRGSGRTGDPRRDGSRRAAWLPVAFVALGVAELAILIAIGVNTSLWWSVLIVVLGWIIGVALLITAGQQSFVRLRSLVRAVRGSGDVEYS
ncbi:xanthine/uracil permease [Brachybacterium muris]|uniref:FxsA family protein n=1 Tax=Brachybacterium muris TaxID=219301 RepID=UPI001EF91103|nr:FxsA family protein [Brachybacterium muris]MBM7500699.1 xanthine/uracil permease [Brachybacterium muris]